MRLMRFHVLTRSMKPLVHLSGAKKVAEKMEKLKSDCNLTAGLEAVLKVSVGARVMLLRNIDTSKGLVNGAVVTLICIKAHHIAVQFDHVPAPYQVEKVKSKLMIIRF